MPDSLPLPLAPSRPRLYYGWINLLLAALAMVATLPGRTQGLSLITEPLLHDLALSPEKYALLNLYATLLGSTFCLATGPLIDRLGSRTMLTATALLLALSVLFMARITTPTGLLIALTLTRGFGQSALSVISLTLVGKWFSKKLPRAMAVYSVLLGLGFCIAIPAIGYAVMHTTWRSTWTAVGYALLALAPLAFLLVRNTPESLGLPVDGLPTSAASPRQEHSALDQGLTLPQALATPAFWAFTLSAAAFGFVSSGLVLFNEAILTQRGMDKNTVLLVLAVITFTGLLANFLGGYLAEEWPLGRLMALAMALLAAALLALPLARGPVFIYSYAVGMGLAAGLVTVVFFVCWGQVFGRRQLGAIQGAAQLLTVLSSATGPALLARTIEQTGSSSLTLMAMALLVAALGLACLLAPVPPWPTAAEAHP